MLLETVLVIDADQFPLQECFSKEELHKQHVIASSNREENLIKNGAYFGGVTPKFKEAADTYLVLKLEETIRHHSISKVVLASKDKKLLYMLLNLICWLDKKIVIQAHALCPGGSVACLYDACNYYGVRCKDTKQKNANEVINHLRHYQQGLRLETLCSHFNVSEDKMRAILNPLIKNHKVYNCGNVFITPCLMMT